LIFPPSLPPPSRPEAGGEIAPIGVYVHFPWCLAKCPYCDFVSYAAAPAAIDHAEYADAVIRELDARAPSVAGRRLETVFFGGGTPSLWEPRSLGRVLRTVRDAFASAGGRADPEVTVECNPTSLDEDRARALADVGVNRLSIGVQSLDDGRLRFLGRLHDAAGGRRAVQSAMRTGISRVSADLIFGIAGQTVEEATAEARELVDLGLSHMSCYQLTIEAGTRFGELSRRGRLPLADDGLVSDAFVAIDEALSGRGLRHYEVSNFAVPGQEARHNLGYWRGDEYLGLGCGAFGFVRVDGPGAAAGVRYRNAVLPDRYVERTASRTVETRADDICESREGLDAETLLRERIMLGLRVAEGVDVGAAARELRTAGWTAGRLKAAAWLEQRGRIVREGSRVRIPRGAWLWTDDTAARLF
jgi:putative oxygen-independent coproporphyrinogen III oxidase